MFLQKVRKPWCKHFNDEEWITFVGEVGPDADADIDGVRDDIPETAASSLQPRAEEQDSNGHGASAKVRLDGSVHAQVFLAEAQWHQ